MSISFCECETLGTSCIRDASPWLRHISPSEVCEFTLSGEDLFVSVGLQSGEKYRSVRARMSLQTAAATAVDTNRRRCSPVRSN